jgi:hypothetical protein
MEQVRTRSAGFSRFQRDATANDSDKSFVVPTGKIWKLRYVEALLVADATVGNRVLICLVSNGTSFVHVGMNSGNIAASQVGVGYWGFGGNAYTDTTNLRRRLDTAGTPNVSISTNGPEMVIPAGYFVQVRDNSGVSAAGDDLTVVIHYEEFDA